ncbi:NADH-quinone oxidoreductase subunit NuoG [Thermoflexus sp.]|uniref:NADH-quinone oxidoreductase subunit NuoG n=1 Tax=Thermoflexus sp. TaxID=1969742 RepID=UPI002ADDA714|nr:NADH-quinone oxidoreductase subunit NuoG [Thermoflexus sp.]
MTGTVRVIINDRPIEVPAGTLVVDAAKRLGVDIPVFCYHPKLEPAGMCRMCLVEIGMIKMDPQTRQPMRDEEGRPVIQWMPRLQTACTTRVAEGMVVRTNTLQVQEAQRAILEFLLTSHPLDCPICDKGGECPLQNLTMRYGPGESRFDYADKMHQEKRVPLGDLILLDRERCILCGRCIRFQEEIADDPVLGFSDRGRGMEIITFSDPPFASYFSGNTTDICPVGALTTTDFRFRARPWEMTPIPSICPHCPVGCNITLDVRPSARKGGWDILRVMPRQHEAVNEIWICDKGRFVHHFATAEDRLRQPLIRRNGELTPVSWEDVLEVVAEALSRAGPQAAGLVGDRLPNEDLYLFRRLFGEALGSSWISMDPPIFGGEWVARYGVGTGTDFGQMRPGSLIVVMAGDLEEEAPVWFLRVRGAVRRGARLIVAGGKPQKAERYADLILRYRFGTEALVLVGALQVLLDENRVAPEVLPRLDGLEALRKALEGYPLDFIDQRTGVPVEQIRAFARAIAEAGEVVLIFGREGVVDGEAFVGMAANVLALTGHVGRPNNGLLPLWPHANTQGALDFIGARPLPEEVPVLYVVGADPVGDGRPMPRAGFLIVQDLFLTETARMADVVLPAQSWAERDGTFTSAERRVQRFYKAIPAVGEARGDWEIFIAIALRLGQRWRYLSPEAVMDEIARTDPRYAGMDYGALAWTQPQWPPVGTSRDLYFGGTARPNTAGLGRVRPSEAETPEARWPLAWKAPEIPSEESILAIPTRRLYQEGTLIARTPHLRGRTVPWAARMHPETARRLGLEAGQMAVVRVNGQTLRLPALVDPSVPSQVILLPASLTARAGVVEALPVKFRVEVGNGALPR